MKRKTIAICTVAFMGMASLVSCNQTTINENKKQNPTQANAALE